MYHYDCFYICKDLTEGEINQSINQSNNQRARKHVRDARNFNNIETRAAIKLFFLQGKAPKEIHAILTETLACLRPGRAKDLSAPLMCVVPGTESKPDHSLGGAGMILQNKIEAAEWSEKTENYEYRYFIL